MAKLKFYRERQNLTQEELSEKSGISVRTIQRIESGTQPKGYTLKTLAKTLEVDANSLTEQNAISKNENIVTSNGSIEEQTNLDSHNQPDFTKIKLINLSSVFFVVVPPLNILAPIVLSRVFKQKNSLINQIISVQIFWTILAPIVFFLGIFLKLGNQFTLFLIAFIILSNIFIILSNSYQIDKTKKLRYNLNFNII